MSYFRFACFIRRLISFITLRTFPIVYVSIVPVVIVSRVLRSLDGCAGGHAQSGGRRAGNVRRAENTSL